jgi:hypothetical protein
MIEPAAHIHGRQDLQDAGQARGARRQALRRAAAHAAQAGPGPRHPIGKGTLNGTWFIFQRTRHALIPLAGLE